ncbi:hypothetical protein MJG53_004503 [Ovis ammon polii x Ovis aries]|uniref:Uncharacterized protein n=1 Tax=Ovis ammon polii x Ovis aries TaxID=2918886 RepID=A0ACB9VB65_9CETA|nr:hypothetical protein MJG53_004503 [Ovis ammon polii x Ovis aries]
MGFALERFAESVDPDFQCRLCGQVLEEPLCTPCGHVFCARCLLPWAARRRRCPLQCGPLAPGELYRVLPLRSLVQKLRIQCDYRPRGCGRSVQLSELAAHVERCDFGPARRRHPGSVSRPNGLGSGDRSLRGGCSSAPGIRRGGGGGACGGSPGVRGGSWRGPRPRVWRRREKALLAQLWELQGEVRLTARRYQEKLTQYMAHVRNFVRDLGGGHDAEGEHKPLTIVLERENDTLGFNIIGGRPNQNNQEETPMEGIYVSKILKNGPADRADGLEIHDKIIEHPSLGKNIVKFTYTNRYLNDKSLPYSGYLNLTQSILSEFHSNQLNKGKTGVFKGKMVFPLTSKGDEARRTHESGPEFPIEALLLNIEEHFPYDPGESG